MEIPFPLLPHEPSASPVNVLPEIVNGLVIAAPAPYAEMAADLPMAYSSAPSWKLESVIVGFARSTSRIFVPLILSNCSPLATVCEPSKTNAEYFATAPFIAFTPISNP